MIRLVFSTDAHGFSNNATVIASALRRSSCPVRARIYTRGFEARSFSTGRLEVSFIRCDEPVSGRFPGHVAPAVFDRLRIIRDPDGWDRALVMDHDMLVLCDLEPYFREPFGQALLMGRLFGPKNTVGLQMERRGGLPPGWSHAADIPYFHMGPMLNLEAMATEGFWERLLEAHEAIGQDEQISLTAASKGRIRGVGKQWNLVPEWDRLADTLANVEGDPRERREIDGVTWDHGVPQGVIHWTGPAKPWHFATEVWRADLWESESTGWEELRSGLWDKPLVREISPRDWREPVALLKRGWRVIADFAGTVPPEGARSPLTRFPDLEIRHRPGPLRTEDSSHSEFTRFEEGREALAWLGSLRPGETPPLRIVVRGPVDAEPLHALRAMGYGSAAAVIRDDWPAGGPDPSVLEFGPVSGIGNVAPYEDLHLSLEPPSGEESQSARTTPAPPIHGRHRPPPDFLPPLVRAVADLSEERPAILLSGPRAIEAVVSVLERKPGARPTVLVSEASAHRAARLDFAGNPAVAILHSPVDPLTGWLSLAALPPGDFHLIAASPPEPDGRPWSPAALRLAPRLAPGGVIFLEEPEETPADTPPFTPWKDQGLERLQREEPGFVLLGRREPGHAPSGPLVTPPELPRVYVCTSPDPGGAERLRAFTARPLPSGFPLETVEIPLPQIGEILWQEASLMTAKPEPGEADERLLVQEVHARRSLLAALSRFLDSGEDLAIVCDDRCRPIRDAADLLPRVLAELPAEWDFVHLYGFASPDSILPHSPLLARAKGVAGCFSSLWSRRAAERLVPALASSRGTVGAFLRDAQSEASAFLAIPFVALPAPRTE